MNGAGFVAGNNIVKIKLLRNFLIVSLSIAIAFSLYNAFFIYPSFTNLLIESTKKDAVRFTKYLASEFIAGKDEMKKNTFNAVMLSEIERLKNVLGLMKLQVFSSSGVTIFSTDYENIGKINKQRYFHEIVAKGKVHAKIVPKDTKSLDGQRVMTDVVETYVPLMAKGKFLGAFEIYYDITHRKKQLDKLLPHSSVVLFILTTGLLFTLIIVIFKEKKIAYERKRTETALQESEEKLSGILNAVPDLIIVVDKDFNIIWSNHIAEEFFGSDPIGMKCYDAFNSRPEPCISCCVQRCFEDGRSDEHEIEVIGKDGTRMDLWCTVSVATRAKDGTPKSVIVVYRDITEKKLLQAETAKNSQLAAIGELATGVAHEINNPINGIINCAQMLIDDNGASGEQTDISKRIIKAGGRIAMIVRNLLSYACNNEDVPDLVHVQCILSDSLDLTGAQIRKNGIDLKAFIPDEIPKVKVRSHQIQQVFLNIISNAWYAIKQKSLLTNEGKVIEINGEVINVNGNKYVRVTFFDTGIGIPANILERICDPFFSNKPPGEGTGLGLSISHSIIKDHGGRLNFESIEGNYTKAMVDLPVPVEENI